jgi:hypothetical protein
MEQQSGAGSASCDAKEKRMLLIDIVAILLGMGSITCVQSDGGSTFHVRMVVERDVGREYFNGIGNMDGAWVGEAIVSDEHVEQLRFTRSDAGLDLDVVLSPNGVRRLNEATSTNLGRSIAVLINSCLVTVVPITGPSSATSTSLLVGLELPDEDVRALESILSRRWPPGRD